MLTQGQMHLSPSLFSALSPAPWPHGGSEWDFVCFIGMSGSFLPFFVLSGLNTR